MNDIENDAQRAIAAARPTALLCLLPGLAFAADPASHQWKASSQTAMAITGDLTISPTRITFANNRALTLTAAASSPA